jgi:hypothetical protein
LRFRYARTQAYSTRRKPFTGSVPQRSFGYNKIAMSRVSVAEAKNKSPELIKAVENGERITSGIHFMNR